MFIFWLTSIWYTCLFQLKVDKSTIDFGTSVIGETLRKTFVLSNNGALGTRFQFFKVTGMKTQRETTAETSLGRMVRMKYLVKP